MKKTTGFLVLTLLPLLFQAQTVVLTTGCRSAYDDILSLKFDEGKIKLQAEKEANPDNLYPVYLENYIDFLTLFIGENEDDFHRLEGNKSLRIDLIGELSDSSPYKKYMLGNIYLQWAVARIKFKEYFTAAFEINRAYRLLEDNHREFPEFVPNNISLGLLHIVIGLVPDKYRWILKLILMKGDVEQGRGELLAVLEKSKTDPRYAYLRDETLFYLGFVDLNISSDNNKALDLLDELEEDKEDNLMLAYLTINILMRTGQNEKALEELNRIGDREGYLPFYYLDYLHGECLLRKLDTGAAREKFTVFLESFTGRNYLKSALRKKSWTFLLNGDTLGYFETMQKIFSVGNTDVDSDKQAVFEAKKESVPNTGLLKVMLLYDGGYYFKAGSVLDKIDPLRLTDEQKIEFFYRKAGIAAETGSIEEAKAAYLLTIKIGKSAHRYFAGSSALKLARIYESEGNLEQAEYFYRACLKMDFIEYETSIHAKAKTGLLRITEKQE